MNRHPIPADATPDAAHFWALLYPTRAERALDWASLQLSMASECETPPDTGTIDPFRSHGHLCRLAGRLERWSGFLRRRRVAGRAR